MAFKSILTVLESEVQSALGAAIGVAKQNDAHLNVLCLGIDPLRTGYYFANSAPEIINDSAINAREEALACEKAACDVLEKEQDAIKWSTKAVAAEVAGVHSAVGVTARFNDLVVLSKPYGKGGSDNATAILEAALFSGHAPVLIFPDGDARAGARKVVVAWNESAEAIAAIRAALPILINADEVVVTIIDPPKHDENRADPGAELSKMLARHGVNVTVSVLAKTMPRVSDMLMRHATDIGADLVVMGAYGHSRLRESILGGATRDMLEDANLPVLMAR